MENGGRKHDGSGHDPHQRKIQKLERIFKECPRPDEKRRHQLSRELGLAPRLIKFWFLNKRIQILKGTQYERSDYGCEVRAESNRVNQATGLGDARPGCKDPKISKP